MARKPTSMRKIREILRLRHEMGLSHREIGLSLGMAPSTVGDLLNRTQAQGLSWPVDAGVEDSFLEELLYHPQKGHTYRNIVEPDFAYIHRELRRKHVTLQILWQEYRLAHPNGYQYSQYCQRYRNWAKNLDLVMRQHHRPGYKLFVDYAGTTMPILCPESGKKQFDAQIFVASMGASGYTFAEASRSQEKASWIRSHINAFRFFGGITELIVPDNLRSGVTKACSFEPDINPTYFDMAKYYGTAILPAGKQKPKHKAKVELGVLLVSRWILAALRNRQFYSLFELNKAISELLLQLNDKPFQKLQGSRRSKFEELDRPFLKPLPAEPYSLTDGKIARVHIDYHLEIEKSYYSVPYTLVRKEVEVRYNDSLVEIYFNNSKIASHQRSFKVGSYTTLKDHMPSSHRHQAGWTPQRLTNWANEAGPSTAKVAQEIMKNKPPPEVGFKAVLGLISLGKKYGKERVEKASERALAIRSPTYKSVKSILTSGFDKIEISRENRTNINTPTHQNIRGREYFSNFIKQGLIE